MGRSICLILQLCLAAVGSLMAETQSTRRSGAAFTDEDRTWWSFQAVHLPVVPAVADAALHDGFRVRNPIDAFIFNHTRETGRRMSPEAERVALMRRVTFDLTGLPPSPAEIEAFLADPSDDSYERLVDRLLASPRHGEHWARPWLDLVRYAESDGYKQDAYRPEAWRYRDYVVAAFNDDRPYDRFVQDQLAGDEVSPDDPQALAATGFYRACVYEYNNRDAKAQWQAILAEATDTVGDVFLGLGLQCARCHDHKFDPIRQEDYYRLQACFAGMVWRDDAPAADPVERAAWQEKHTAWRREHDGLLAEMEAFEAPFQARQADGVLDKFPKELEGIWRRGAAAWTSEERPWMIFVSRQIAEETRDPSRVMSAEEKVRWRDLKARVAAAEATAPPPLARVPSVVDPAADAAPTRLPGTGRLVSAGFLSIMGGEDVRPGQSRRRALAEWLTRPDHPLTARVMVNRLWQGYFGRGLVATPNDFGRLGEKPVNQPLLDWLADTLVKGGWRLKPLHRLIVTSTTYREAGGTPNGWRTDRPRRLTAEEIRDASLAVSGELVTDAGGPSVSSDQPRRTIFTKALRNSPDPLIQSFDAPDAFRSAGTRQNTTTATQSLLMVNGQWMQRRAAAFARDLREKFPGLSVEQVRQAYLRTTGHDPTSEEIAEGLTFVKAQTDAARREAASPAPEVAFAESRDLPRHGMSLVISKSNAEKGLFPAVVADDLTGDGRFTLEAVIFLRSLWPDDSVRTIASRWDGEPTHQGWSLGVAGQRGSAAPGSLVLEIVGQEPADGGPLRHTVVASDLAVPLNRTWMVAASVGENAVTFVVRDLGDEDATPKQVVVPTGIVAIRPAAGQPLILGARGDAGRSQRFDGLMGEVRLSRRPLDPARLLGSSPGPGVDVIAHWKFEMAGGPLTDDSPAGHSLRLPALPEAPSPDLTGLADFCHALLNSNAFLYVD